MTIKTVAIIGLGYVGLPLAVHLARAAYNVVGVDIDTNLVEALNSGTRPTRDLPAEIFPIPSNMQATTKMPADADVYIVCVPTPDLNAERMDDRFVTQACRDIGAVMKDGAIVVIESTVTPGSTNGILRNSVRDTKGNARFHMAFSPERVNPGSRYFYEMGNTEKLVGTTPQPYVEETLTEMYGRIFEKVVVVGIEEAEIAKAFENMQRDVNIALMNELAIECEKKGVKYTEVVKGLRTKKTSPVFTSGMVGGHCIPVDPYFMAEYYGSNECLPMYGRLVNEAYTLNLANIAIDYNPSHGRIIIIGKSYKNGVIDMRNSGAFKLARYLKADFEDVVIHDPMTDPIYEGTEQATLVIGATNHDPNMRLFEYYNCHTHCVFVNLGGRFTEAQTAPFRHNVVEL